jgi:putative endonuclease
MYYVYVLKSQKDGNLYIGQTSNLDRRLQYHNSGRVKSTKRRIPFKLIYVEEFANRKEAMKREKLLKDIESRDFKRMLRNTAAVG